MDGRKPLLIAQFMKKITLLLFFGLFSLSVMAQRGQRPDREQLEAARIAFITTRLDLTPEQAQQFWPLYNEFKNGRNTLLRQISKLSGDEVSLSEEQAKQHLQKRFEIQKAMIAEEMTFVDKASAVLTYNQILKLNGIDRDFTRQIFQRQRRGNNE